mmetsp:Transcript_3142/g.10376  ORF Transcript_3142/g.10376 Transcript_3142/m.10376 type:complete len:259 (+) Transcript_3142:30-806(+)
MGRHAGCPGSRTARCGPCRRTTTAAPGCRTPAYPPKASCATPSRTGDPSPSRPRAWRSRAAVPPRSRRRWAASPTCPTAPRSSSATSRAAPSPPTSAAASRSTAPSWTCISLETTTRGRRGASASSSSRTPPAPRRPGATWTASRSTGGPFRWTWPRTGASTRGTCACGAPGGPRTGRGDGPGGRSQGTRSPRRPCRRGRARRPWPARAPRASSTSPAAAPSTRTTRGRPRATPLSSAPSPPPRAFCAAWTSQGPWRP